MQRIARRALIDGLVKFDRSKAGADRFRKSKSPAIGAFRSALSRRPSDIQPWRLGVVLESQKAKAIIGLKPARQQDGTLVKDREAVEVPLEELKWAKIPVKKIEAEGRLRSAAAR